MNKKELITVLRAMLEAVVQETPPKRPVTTPDVAAGHEAHLVASRYGGLDLCCSVHSEEYEERCRHLSRPPGAMDYLTRGQREYIAERFGRPR